MNLWGLYDLPIASMVVFVLLSVLGSWLFRKTVHNQEWVSGVLIPLWCGYIFTGVIIFLWSPFYFLPIFLPLSVLFILVLLWER